jgi:hypothetical protein
MTTSSSRALACHTEPPRQHDAVPGCFPFVAGRRGAHLADVRCAACASLDGTLACLTLLERRVSWAPPHRSTRWRRRRSPTADALSYSVIRSPPVPRHEGPPFDLGLRVKKSPSTPRRALVPLLPSLRLCPTESQTCIHHPCAGCESHTVVGRR